MLTKDRHYELILEIFLFSELKKKYIDTVTKLANMCNNDGLAALLEIDNDLVTELRQLISMVLMSMGLTLDDVCLDALQEATATAKNLRLIRIQHPRRVQQSERPRELAKEQFKMASKLNDREHSLC